MVVIAQLVFVVVVIYMLVKECIKIYKQRKKYMKDPWNVFEFVLIWICVTGIAMYAIREVWGRAVLSQISENKGITIS